MAARSISWARRASYPPALAGAALFATAVIGDVSEVASIIEASLGAVIAVSGYDLAASPSRKSPGERASAAATIGVIRSAAFAFLVVSLADWIVRTSFDLATVTAALVFSAGAATSCSVVREYRRGQDGEEIPPDK